MLIGADFSAITEQHLQALVDASISEDQDLDFKGAGYDPTHKGDLEIAKDIAALANQLGGMLIVGIAEDANGRANQLSPVRIGKSKGLELQVRQALAKRSFPMIQGTEVREIRSSADPTLSYYIIAVPRSVDAPHSVLHEVGNERWPMFWPIRNGTSTRYLHEAELASRYRDRFALAQGQLDRLGTLHTQGSSRGESGQITSLVLDAALAPGIAGNRALTGDSPTIHDFLGVDRPGFRSLGMQGDLSNAKLVPLRRRLRVETAYCRLELHSDGAAWGRTFVGIPAVGPASPLRINLDRFETALHGLISIAGEYAAWAGAAGECLVSVHLGGQVDSHLLITDRDGGRILAQPVGLKVSPAELTWPLDDLCTFQGAGRAAYVLARDLEQDFGVVQPVFLQEDGQLSS